jgi:hypothetical protein
MTPVRLADCRAAATRAADAVKTHLAANRFAEAAALAQCLSNLTLLLPAADVVARSRDERQAFRPMATVNDEQAVLFLDMYVDNARGARELARHLSSAELQTLISTMFQADGSVHVEPAQLSAALRKSQHLDEHGDYAKRKRGMSPEQLEALGEQLLSLTPLQ